MTWPGGGCIDRGLQHHKKQAGSGPVSINPGRLPLGPRPPEVPNWMVNRGQYKLLCKVPEWKLEKKIVQIGPDRLCHAIAFCTALHQSEGRMDEQCAEQSHVRLAMVSGLLFILRKPETCNAVDPQDFTCTFRSPAASHTPGRRRVRLRRNPAWLRSGTRKQAGFSKPVLHHVRGYALPQKAKAHPAPSDSPSSDLNRAVLELAAILNPVASQSPKHLDI